MSTPTRQRIVEAGAALLRAKGYSATGVKEIVVAAQAPFGSLYHHFPGGKEQLGEEVVRWSGREYGKLGPLVFDAAPDVVTGVRMFFAGAAETLEESGWIAACPIATVALEVANTREPRRRRGRQPRRAAAGRDGRRVHRVGRRAGGALRGGGRRRRPRARAGD